MYRYFHFFIFCFYSSTLFANLEGDWYVSRVYINTDSSSIPQIAINDPIYRYRIIQINESEIKNNLYSSSGIELCQNYNKSEYLIDFNIFLNQKMARNINQTLSAESFGINIINKVKMIEISCTYEQEKWYFAKKNADGYFLINNPFYILEIEKISNNKMNPSFSCNNAKETSENFICNNIYLAGLDKSIHDLYFVAKKNLPNEDFEVIKDKQKIFLKERNSCLDINCLMEIMSNQLLFLKEQLPVITL